MISVNPAGKIRCPAVTATSTAATRGVVQGGRTADADRAQDPDRYLAQDGAALRIGAGDERGRKELAARAKIKEESRDKALAVCRLFEYGSAVLQLAMVLAGASAPTSVTLLLVMSMGWVQSELPLPSWAFRTDTDPSLTAR